MPVIYPARARFAPLSREPPHRRNPGPTAVRQDGAHDRQALRSKPPTRPPTPSSPVLVERDGAVATVRLNRPDAMNSLDIATKDALVTRPDRRRRGPERAVRGADRQRPGVLRGPGPARAHHPAAERRPVAVGHRGQALQPGRRAARDDEQAGRRGRQRRRRRRGCGLRARGRLPGAWSTPPGFNLAFAGIALSCDSGSSWSLQRIVGPAKAKELLLLPRTVPADECLSLGLVTKVVPADDFDATVHELATTLAAGPTLAYGSIRRAVAFSCRARPDRVAGQRG